MASEAPVSTLFIGRLHNQYLVPAELSWEDLRHRCESSLQADLMSSISRSLDRRLPAQDPSLWFVRKLALDFPVSAEAPGHIVADVWAEEIAAGLVETLVRGRGEDVIRFPDRAAYRARFFLDLADGSAWSKWYYAPFDGLRALSLTAALRTAMLDSMETTLEALDLLGDQAFQLVRALCPGDAARVLTGLTAGPSAGGLEECVLAAIGAVETAPYADEDHRALNLYLSARRNTSGRGGHLLGDAVRAVARLLRCLEERPAAHNLNDSDDLATLYRAFGPEHAPVLAPLLSCPGAVLNLLHSGKRAGGAERRYTHFGGVFLLLPLIDELPLPDWPDADIVRFLILVKCLGRDRALGCFRDALLRDLLRIKPELDADQLAQWSQGVRREHLDRWLAALLDWHMRKGTAAGPPFHSRQAQRRGAPVILSVDRAREIWTGYPAAGSVDAEFSGAVTKDLDYLSLPRNLGVRRGVDLALSVAAQGVLRNFAWKLPGFALSSLPHLFANFLDCCAAVEEASDLCVIRLGRAPLHLILGMAGLNRRSYQLSWMERPCAVFPED